MAAGGEGAPLAPFFHHAVFADATESRAVLNLGGMSNVTWLPAGADPEKVVAFDVGPANALVDAVISLATDGRERMDEGGVRAERGRVDDALLAELMGDAYLAQLPPKSTGRERYGRAEAEVLLGRWRAAGRELDDLVATLVAFTASSVAHAVSTLLPAVDPTAVTPARLLVAGGGAFNPAMLAALARALPDVAVERCRDHGVPDEGVEAMAFSLMGRNTVLGVPNHLPACTGAGHACVLGERAPGHDGQV
jgi:anhydro-N-acetylmuramic acid kinase